MELECIEEYDKTSDLVEKYHTRIDVILSKFNKPRLNWNEKLALNRDLRRTKDELNQLNHIKSILLEIIELESTQDVIPVNIDIALEDIGKPTETDWKKYVGLKMKSLKYEKKIRDYLRQKRSVYLREQATPLKSNLKRLVKDRGLLDRQAELVLKVIILKLNLALNLVDENPYAQTNLFRTVAMNTRAKKIKYLLGFCFTLLCFFVFLMLFYNDYKLFQKKYN